MPRHRWSLSVVTKLLRGSDALCRAAVVRTAHGLTTRSLIKLFPLELSVRIEEKADSVHANEQCLENTQSNRQAAQAARELLQHQVIDSEHDSYFRGPPVCRVLGSGTYSLVGEWTRILIYCLSDSLFLFALFFDTINNTLSDNNDLRFIDMYIVIWIYIYQLYSLDSTFMVPIFSGPCL